MLPTTPFVLLAAWFFARSSEDWHRRLLQSELFGPMIRNWEVNRCLSPGTKVVAISAMTVAGSASIIYAIDNPYLQVATLLLMMIGAITVLLIRTCRGRGAADDEHEKGNAL